MKIQSQINNSTSTTLTVDASQEEMTKTKDRVAQELTSKVKVAGFRTGKAPLNLKLKEVDPQKLQEAFLTSFVPQAAQQALNLKKIKPILTPEVSVTKFVPYESLEITIKAEHLGKIKLADYHKMSEKMPKIEVSPEEIEKITNKIQLDFATFKEVKRVSQLKDRVWLDFEGFDAENKAVNGASGQDYPLILGSQTFIPGFEEKLVGYKSNQKIDFKLRFPKDYQAKHLADSEVTFKVFLKKVEVVSMPALNNDLAAKLGNFKTWAETKKFIKEQIMQDKQKRMESMFQGQIVAKLSEQSEIEIPEGLIKLETEALNSEHQTYLKENQLELNTWLKSMKLTLKEHEDKLKVVATNRIKGGIVLREIALAEKIEIKQDEIDSQFAQEKKDSLSPQQELNLRQDIQAHLLTQKSLNKLIQIVSK